MSDMKKKILYAEDAGTSLRPVSPKFHELYNIRSVMTADALFKMLGNFLPDIILLDIISPEINAFETIRILKDTPKYADIPVAFVANSSETKALKKAVGLGAADLLLKPFSRDEFFKRIENLLVSEKQDEYLPMVLTVDDNPGILKTINMLLSGWYKVHTLVRPEMLQESLKKIVPDIFLLDYNMPGLNGFELVPIIRALPQHAKTPIIFVTSEGTINNLAAAIKLGAGDFIVKPIDEMVLLEKMAANTAEYMVLRSLRKIID